MLTGKVPFQSKTPQALLAAQLTAKPAPLPARRDDVPVALSRLIMQCLEKERERRPQSARELAEMLDHPDMVSGAFASAPQIAVPRRRWPMFAAVAALLVAVGGAGAGSVIVQGRDDLELMQGSTMTIQASSPIRREPNPSN